MQCARDSCKDICLGEGTVPGFGQIAHLFLYLGFLFGKKSFQNKAIVLSELSTTAFSVLAVNLRRTNSGGKSIRCFQEQLI